jgi:hypothetical protein
MWERDQTDGGRGGTLRYTFGELSFLVRTGLYFGATRQIHLGFRFALDCVRALLPRRPTRPPGLQA